MLKQELWVAEYSFGQRCFHHDLLKKSIETNKKQIKKIMQITDKSERTKQILGMFVPFAIGTDEETRLAIEKMTEVINQSFDWKQFYNPLFLSFSV